MKRIFAVICAVGLFLGFSSCYMPSSPPKVENSDKKTEYVHITEIDHCVVEPDDRLHMTDDDKENYKNLMEAMLSRKDKVELTDSEDKISYYLDLLKQSPYCFFVKSLTQKDGTIYFEYAYSKEEQAEMLSFLDTTLLDIVNENAQKSDNDLDKLLKVYQAVTHRIEYDHERVDNKHLDSPLFKYPNDEIYKALKYKKSLCFGFAYTYRFAMLQLNIDCFCVYGECKLNNEAHMWNIFKLNDRFYTCDPSWDRSDDSYAKLYHFGKTDSERESDSLFRTDFSKDHFEEYGEVKCVDESFKLFRGISRFSYVSGHSYFVKSYDGEENIFNSETLSFEDE